MKKYLKTSPQQMRKRISTKIKLKIWEQAGNRCGYCLSNQDYVLDTLEIDHIIPLAKGGTDEEENLWLICGTCNNAKYNKTEALDKETQTVVPLFNPRLQKWSEHFAWSEDGILIIGKTPTGRATITALKLNRGRLLIVRRNWVSVGWHPPED